MNGVLLEQVSEFKYLRGVLNDCGTDESDCNNRVVKERQISGAVRSLVNERCLNMKCAKVLHEKLVVPVLIYGSECMVWKSKQR